MNVLETRTFKNTRKKLHKNQKEYLDEAIKQIKANPSIGEQKEGDLAAVRVYKFQMVNQLTLLAYSFNATTIILRLIALGSHENFYRDLKL